MSRLPPRFRRGGELIEEMRRARDARSLDLAWLVSMGGSALLIALYLAMS